MQACHPEFQTAWNRFIAVAAFLLTAIFNVGAAAQSEEIRLTKAQPKHHEAAVTVRERVWSVSIRLDDARSDNGGTPHFFILPPAFSIDAEQSAAIRGSGGGTSLPSPHSHNRQARAPPSI